MKQKILFIDRDGTILVEPEDDHQIDSLDKFAFVPGVISNLAKIAKELDYELVMVTNQDGLGTKNYPEETFWPTQNLMIDILESEGVVFSKILIDRSFEKDKLPTRKPETGLVKKYLNGNYDLKQSYVIGDRLTDVALARNMGIKALLIGDEPNEFASLTTNNWSEIYRFLAKCPRKSVVDRNTSETNIHVALNLDGTGETSINTGLGFFDHMLEQLGKHGGFNLAVDVAGDLQIDEHHTIEDTALALGEAFDQALGKRKGILRYGFLLPMDDCLAQVALDFGGRPYLVWNATFKREKIGEMPTEMFRHFFKSFCGTARCNLNISAEGENEHHKIEAIFKGWAKSLKQAMTRTNDGVIPSTKGIL